jgi:DNA-directed RNA polymerase subunit L
MSTFTEYKQDASSGSSFATFRLVNSNTTLANTLRRAILTLTPSVGFRTEPYEKSDVRIDVNTTPLVNEMIAHRIGMIPVNANPDTFNPDDYEFVLDITNDTKEIINVHASDFKVYMKNPENPLGERIEVESSQLFPPDPITGDTILITRLRPQWNPAAPKEQLTLTARACVSIGKENIRWSPVSQSSFENTRDADETKYYRIMTQWAIAQKKFQFPKPAEGEPELDTSGDIRNYVERGFLTGERLAELTREFETMEAQRCFVTDEYGNPNDFTFSIESVGIQPVPHIVSNGLQACVALVGKYRNVDTAPDLVRVQQGDSRFSTMDVIFTNESHTLGNLLETYMIYEYMDAMGVPKGDSQITYVGYKVPHPLRPEMVLRVGISDEADESTRKRVVLEAVANVCRKLEQMFTELKAAWDAQFAAGAAGPAQ